MKPKFFHRQANEEYSVQGVLVVAFVYVHGYASGVFVSNEGLQHLLKVGVL